MTLTGATPAHHDLAREGTAAVLALLRDDLESSREGVWLDRLADGTTRPLDLAALAGDAGLPGDVVRGAAALLENPDAAAALAEETLGPLLRSVPGLSPEDRRGLDPVDLVRRARDAALDRLLPEGEA